MALPAEARAKPEDRLNIHNAIVLHRQGRLSEAEQIYLSLLAGDPGQLEALHLLGLARHQQGRAVEALSLIGAALRARPDWADALSNYGLALEALQRHEEALASFDRALALEARHANALNNRGVTLAALGRDAEAIASWEAALAADPNHLNALHNRGNALQKLKQHGAALATFDRFIALQPDNLDVLNNRGRSLATLGRLLEAIESYDRALAIDPRRPEILINKAHVLAELHEFDRALAVYATAAAIEGWRAEAEWYASLVRLRLGDFAPGWAGYQWRWRQRSWETQRRDFATPLWLGRESLAGRTILLHAEQGCGDTLQFARYVQKVAALGATVLLEVQPPLRTLFEDFAGATRVFARGETLPSFDWHCPLMSLPLAFGTSLDAIPREIPYVQAPADRARKWRERLPACGAARVGIVWSGSPAHKNDHNRSIAAARFAPLLAAPGVEFIGLQTDLARADVEALSRQGRITQLGPELDDFADTAAIVSQLDLIVSVDTSVVHLAGALGKPVWVLLPFTPDFRWLMAREDSPWYPTARLFRQPRHGDWDSVLAQAARELQMLAMSG
jgi:tetratricopeptide (TPR) repeat protein